jgi:hypothetical protein
MSRGSAITCESLAVLMYISHPIILTAFTGNHWDLFLLVDGDDDMTQPSNRKESLHRLPIFGHFRLSFPYS